MEEVVELFDYQHAKVPDDCKYLISPSQISKFFEYPKIWYQENMLGEKPEFKGNTSTVLGTICHYIYEQVAQGKKVTKVWIDEQLDKQMQLFPNDDVDVDEVKRLYPIMTPMVVNNYILTYKGEVECERPVLYKVDNGIYVAGTADRIELDTGILCDYKNVSTKPNENVIPFHYKVQLLAYAKALRSEGYNIDRIRIIYGVRPTKTLPARVYVVTEQIDDEAEKLIDDTLNLIAETVLIAEEHPDLIHLLFKSMDLKDK